jgi:hypothetical protein
LRIILAGFLWAIVYGVVWGIAWVTFMRGEWYGALGTGRQMPWTAIWGVWSALCLLLGVATAAYLRGLGRAAGRAKALMAVVLVLWVPMTLGMYGWAWSESFSLGLIAIDSAVNLVALACASLVANAVALAAQQLTAADRGLG